MELGEKWRCIPRYSPLGFIKFWESLQLVTMCVPRMHTNKTLIQSMAEAVPFHDKGEVSVEKVKAKNYVSGKRPAYAPMESLDEVGEGFPFMRKAREKEAKPEQPWEDSSRDPGFVLLPRAPIVKLGKRLA